MVSGDVAKYKWHLLAERHIEMAYHLLGPGFHDGAIFHSYHAYECIVNAIIIDGGYTVPPEGTYWKKSTRPFVKDKLYYGVPKSDPLGDFLYRSSHKTRLELARRLITPSVPYYASYVQLSSFILGDFRNDSLYYAPLTDLLPHEQFTLPDTEDFLLHVEDFIKKVWDTIHLRQLPKGLRLYRLLNTSVPSLSPAVSP